MPEFPPVDLTCPHPSGCTVAVEELTSLAQAGTLPTVTFPADHPWVRVYSAHDTFSTPNPGFGDTRFAPFESLETPQRVPTLYLAESLEAALLETTFHYIHEQDERVVAELQLHGRLHAHVCPPEDLYVVDLRDEQLTQLGLVRADIASSQPEHYPCTRRVAQAIHGMITSEGRRPVGIVWHSRQAELAGRAGVNSMVVFADRVPHGRGSWTLVRQRYASGALLEGAARLALDALAESLGVTFIHPLPPNTRDH